MKKNLCYLIGFFCGITGGIMRPRTGSITPPVQSSTPVVASSSFGAPAAMSMTNVLPYFASIDPTTTFSTLTNRVTVAIAQNKLHDQVNKALTAALQAHDSAAMAAESEPKKSENIYKAAQAYLSAVAALATAQADAAKATERYHANRLTYLKNNSTDAPAFTAAESAAQNDPTQVATFENVYLKKADLRDDWQRMKSSQVTVANETANQNNLWAGLAGPSTLGINIQGLLSAYNALTAPTTGSIDVAAAARIAVIQQSSAQGIPVPVPVVVQSSGVTPSVATAPALPAITAASAIAFGA